MIEPISPPVSNALPLLEDPALVEAGGVLEDVRGTMAACNTVSMGDMVARPGAIGL